MEENPFESLREVEEVVEPVIKEIELHPPPPAAEKEFPEATHLISPAGILSSPSYAKVAKKKPLESSGSLKDESFERPSKKDGRKP